MLIDHNVLMCARPLSGCIRSSINPMSATSGWGRIAKLPCPGPAHAASKPVPRYLVQRQVLSRAIVLAQGSRVLCTENRQVLDLLLVVYHRRDVVHIPFWPFKSPASPHTHSRHRTQHPARPRLNRQTFQQPFHPLPVLQPIRVTRVPSPPFRHRSPLPEPGPLRQR